MIDGLLDSVIDGVFEGAPRDAINNLYKDAQEATVTCECKQNFVNISLYCMNYRNKMQKNYSAWFQQLIIIRKSLTLNFLVLRLPLGVF